MSLLDPGRRCCDDEGPAGDAVYTPQVHQGPDDQELPPGQAADRDSWLRSRARIRASGAARLHFCHHPGVIHS
ncbi:MAG TPA: hypothetical protein VMI33_25805 [Streptosporangiaceae bacterium]|nr:hypothetical protein [Streptosporangiaceae bacterium]